MTRLYQLAAQFRHAIDSSVKEGLLNKDKIFRSFPRGCCGDTCYLLAEFLHKYDIDTVYVCGRYRNQSHAWLVLKDDRVKTPQKQYAIPMEIKDILLQYGECVQQDGIVDTSHYTEADVQEGILIDITADQFDELPVYVGVSDRFHSKFEFGCAHDMYNLENDRLRNLYQEISRFI